MDHPVQENQSRDGHSDARKARRRLFRVTSVFIILGIVCAVEFIARSVNPNRNQFFVADAEGRIAMNEANRLYRAPESGHLFAHFRSQLPLKPEVGKRYIVGVGESTMRGFPYGNSPENFTNGSPLAFVQTYLHSLLPETERQSIAVLNFAFDGSSTEQAAEILEGLAELGLPSIIPVVYTGNNERLPHVRSRILAEQSHPWLTWSRRNLRSVDLFARLWSVSPNLQPVEPLRASSELDLAFVRNLKRQMERISKVAARQATDVLWCTIASNIEFSSGDFFYARELSTQETVRFIELRREASLHWAAGRWNDAADAFEECLKVTGGEVTTLFHLGRLKQHLGQPGEAVPLFRKARNLGISPSKAPDDWNDLIREHARAHGQTCVDLAAAIESYSGNPKFLDWVHPDLEVVAMMGQKITEALLRRFWPSQAASIQFPSFEECIRLKPVDGEIAAEWAVVSHLLVWNPEGATHHWEKLPKREGDVIHDFLEAVMLVQTGRIREACEILQKIPGLESAEIESQIDKSRNSGFLRSLMREIATALPKRLGPHAEPHPMPMSYSESGVEISVPEEAEVTIDGEKQQNLGTWRGTLTRGVHEVVVVSGDRYSRNSVFLEPGENRVVIERFTTIPSRLGLKIDNGRIWSRDGTEMLLRRAGESVFLVDAVPASSNREGATVSGQPNADSFAGAEFSAAREHLERLGKRVLLRREIVEDRPTPLEHLRLADVRRLIRIHTGETLNEIPELTPTELSNLVPDSPWDEWMVAQANPPGTDEPRVFGIVREMAHLGDRIRAVGRLQIRPKGHNRGIAHFRGAITLSEISD